MSEAADRRSSACIRALGRNRLIGGEAFDESHPDTGRKYQAGFDLLLEKHMPRFAERNIFEVLGEKAGISIGAAQGLWSQLHGY